MIEQRFKADTEPHPQKLGDEIRSLMDNGAGSFNYHYDHGTGEVVIHHGHWEGIDLTKVHEAIAAHDPCESEIEAPPVIQPLMSQSSQPVRAPLKKVHRFHLSATAAVIVYEVLRAFGVLH